MVRTWLITSSRWRAPCGPSCPPHRHRIGAKAWAADHAWPWSGAPLL